jgi:1-acyl-sn-glycerol-3-phosphate acyltransferase
MGAAHVLWSQGGSSVKLPVVSQLRLLPARRFAPLFSAQFLGAFNDNLAKNAVIVLLTLGALRLPGWSAESLVALASGVFILPFLLFSATAGQLADRVAKSSVLRAAKLLEIGIAALAAFAFERADLPLLLAALFLFGTRAALFGPAKYAMLPELLAPRELTGANALVATGTFVAILLGALAAGALESPERLGVALVAVAVLGWLASLAVPRLPSAGKRPLRLNPLATTLETYRATRASRPVFLSILGLSWFWFFGAVVTTLLPAYARDTRELTLLLGTACAGIAAGAMLCEKIGGEKLELGLVPLGSFGMSLLALVPAFAEGPVVAAAFFLLGLFGGLYTVPLYTMIQQRSPPESRSRVIAGNNVMNALFMIAAAGLLAVGLEPAHVFVVLAILNGIVAAYIYTVIPEFLLRFVAWGLAHVMYRIRVTGAEQIPESGPAVLVANHVTFVDWLLISSVSPRPIRFVMHYSFMNLPVVGFVFRDAKVIPIAGKKEDESTLQKAFDAIAGELAADELVCIFPEGALTRDGKMAPFRPGIERIIQRTPVPVIPMHISGMWGSFFSHAGGKMLREPFRRVWSKVGLSIGAPVAPSEVTAALLEQRVTELGATPAALRAAS